MLVMKVIDAENNKSLTMMPTKFKKLIWIKRGNYFDFSFFFYE
jgi:hypothetical protein